MGCCCGKKNIIVRKGTEKINAANFRSDFLIQKKFGPSKNNVDRKRKLTILRKQGKIK